METHSTALLKQNISTPPEGMCYCCTLNMLNQVDTIVTLSVAHYLLHLLFFQFSCLKQALIG